MPAPREPLWRRYLRFFGPDVDADVDDELRFHLEMRERSYRERGLPDAEARVAARRRFGDFEQHRRTLRRQDVEIEPLHQRILEQGRQRVEFPPLAELQARVQRDVQRLDPGVLRLVNPHIYHVSMTQGLWDTKQTTIETILRRR